MCVRTYIYIYTHICTVHAYWNHTVKKAEGQLFFYFIKPLKQFVEFTDL